MSAGITAAGVAAAATAVSAIYTITDGFGSKKQPGAPAAAMPAAAAPVVTPPTKLPTPSTTMDAAKNASIAEQMRRRGRASTILTDTADTGTTLGA